jgi:hypothetical protein
MNDPMGAEAPVIRRAPMKKKKKAKMSAGRRPPIVPQAIEHEDVSVQRNSPRPAPRAASREPNRDPSREHSRSGGVAVQGRDGTILTRRRTSVGDKFDVPLNEIPHGWTYQWNAVTILGKGMEEVVVGDRQMYDNGWRPVPATRHDGRFAPHGYQGAIVLEGQRLEERPKSLTDEAQAEDTLRARSQVRDRTDALRMTQKQLPGSDVARHRNNAGGMKMSIDPAFDIPRPEHELDEE